MSRVSRGVKQRNEKGIWVLQATGMPSVLIETGFVTHTEEEQYIISDKGQDEIVNSILASCSVTRQHSKANNILQQIKALLLKQKTSRNSHNRQ